MPPIHPQRPEEDAQSPTNGITDGSVTIEMLAIEVKSSGRTASAHTT